MQVLPNRRIALIFFFVIQFHSNINAAIFSEKIAITANIEKLDSFTITFSQNMGRWSVPRSLLPKLAYSQGTTVTFDLEVEKYAMLIKKYPPIRLGGSGGAGGGR
jgi:hypothetical protein